MVNKKRGLKGHKKKVGTDLVQREVFEVEEERYTLGRRGVEQ
jgi:hypothetical protein